jgi:hypothetical protein
MSGTGSEGTQIGDRDDGSTRSVVTRPSPFQAQILAAFSVDTSAWRSRIT